ncbi:uncharacterized protein LOC130629887 [Hydractinia symbiolongicarpus]|uniref:uncharacterized protein LOC130629887 n=1 Tax=Hydractinia symbiolongicarpus TaxID=13093 RepID=UPI00254C6B73|nr:uncharacterized protein LOC130629887 [Hydractinia symbiolongicarpus]
MSPAVVGRIIHETCFAVWDALHDKGYLETPNNETDWKRIAHKFELKWNFPNALQAIDGKHVLMQAPARAQYKFLLVDIGDWGRQSDGSVYFKSNLGFAIEENRLNIPTMAKLPNSDRVLPYVFVADDAFGLKPHMMKPYPFQNLSTEKRVFNYRLSRERRVVENVFGIATSRFRVFPRPIIAKVEKVVALTKAVVALHNFLVTLKDNESIYCPANFVDRETKDGFVPDDWRKGNENIMGLQDLTHVSSNNYSKNAATVRDKYNKYFMLERAVEWQ